jgi:hypothetical protein
MSLEKVEGVLDGNGHAGSRTRFGGRGGAGTKPAAFDETHDGI